MIRRLLKAALIAVCALALVFLAVLVILTVSEYKPKPTEPVEAVVLGETKPLAEGDTVSVLTFNIGYAGLDHNMDFFMDGGSGNTPESRGKIEENMSGIVELIQSQEYDVLFIQEIDRKAKRSYHLDETEWMQDALGGGVGMFAQNFRCLYVPWPVPDAIGPVHSGLMTLTDYNVRTAERIALPTSFAWPVRTCQLKRCLLTTRIPLENSGRELVLVNLHLEAYGDGEGQMEQTEMLYEFIRNEYEQGNYVIAGGDFNQVFPGDDFTAYPIRSNDNYEPGRLENEIQGEGWTYAYDLSTPTCRLLNQPLREDNEWSAQFYVIDGFILSPNVQLEEVETIDANFEFADHNPVRLTARLLE